MRSEELPDAKAEAIAFRNTAESVVHLEGSNAPDSGEYAILGVKLWLKIT